MGAARLQPTEKVSRCPCKGEASDWSVSAGGDVLPDVALGYSAPLRGAAAVRDHLSFLGEGIEVEVGHAAEVPAAA